MTVNAGIVGYGLAGRVFHAPLLAPAGLRLAAIATSQTEAPARAHPEARLHETPEALFADAGVDLVILATPTPTHGPLAMAALAAGKHVVVDKPFATSAAEADAMIAAAKDAGRMLTCFQNRRWDGDFLTVRKLVEDGTLGEVHDYRAHFDFYKPQPADRWQDRPGPGVGAHFDLGTHLLDQATTLFGTPDWVEGEALTQRPGGGAPDAFHMRLGWGTRRGTLSASYFAPDFSARYVLQGDKGSFRKRHMDAQEAQLKGGIAPGDTRYGVEDPTRHGLLTEPSGRTRRVETTRGDWPAFYRGVRAAIEDGAPPSVDPAEARRTIALIEAVAASPGQRVTL